MTMTKSNPICDGDVRDLSLYVVNEGAVSTGAPDSDVDWTNVILVAATCEAAALAVAAAYDRGEVRADNLPWRGRTIAAAVLRDPDTGRYA